jgi:hypothetical protein
MVSTTTAAAERRQLAARNASAAVAADHNDRFQFSTRICTLQEILHMLCDDRAQFTFQPCSTSPLTRARIMRAREGGDEWPADQVERWPIDRLIPYAKNSRTHSEAQIAQLAASLKEWGWTMRPQDTFGDGRDWKFE